MRREVRRLEAKYIAIKQIRDIKEQIEELKKERVWAEVIENEKVKYMMSKQSNTMSPCVVICPLQVRQAHNVSCPVDQALEFYMPRFQNRTFHGIDNYAYLRHAMEEGHYFAQQNLPITISN